MNIVLDRPEARLPRRTFPDLQILSVEKIDPITRASAVVDNTHGGFFEATYIDGTVGRFFGDDVKVADLIARVAN